MKHNVHPYGLMKSPGEYLVAILDDEPQVVVSLQALLAEDGYQILTANSVASLKATLERHEPPDLVITDLRLQNSPLEGLELIKNFEVRFGMKPGFFVVSGYGDTHILSELVNRGDVYGYLFKPVNMQEFRFRIGNALARIESAKYESGTDGLTGVPNRRSLDEKLDEQIRIWARHLRKWREFADYAKLDCFELSAAFIDIDNFRDFNNRYNHRVGDEVLRATAQTIHGSRRAGDMLARYGGEEFMLIMPNTANHDAHTALHRHSWRVAVETARSGGRVPEMITFSSGIATLTFDLYGKHAGMHEIGLEHDCDREELTRRIHLVKEHLIQAADWAMLKVKEIKKQTPTFRGHCYPGNALADYLTSVTREGKDGIGNI